MKILAFSDVHTDLATCERIVAAARDADLVIGAGDFAQHHGGLAEVMQVLAPIAAKAIYVPGNNETFEALKAATDAPVLHGSGIDFLGLKVFGIGAAIPPLPPLPWGSFDLSEADAAVMLTKASTIDIMVSHSPPKGVVDVHSSAGSIGATSVRAAIVRARPKMVFCGHVHDCWGQSGKIADSVVYNLGPKVNWYDI